MLLNGEIWMHIDGWRFGVFPLGGNFPEDRGLDRGSDGGLNKGLDGGPPLEVCRAFAIVATSNR